MENDGYPGPQDGLGQNKTHGIGQGHSIRAQRGRTILKVGTVSFLFYFPLKLMSCPNADIEKGGTNQ